MCAREMELLQFSPFRSVKSLNPLVIWGELSRKNFFNYPHESMRKCIRERCVLIFVAKTQYSKHSAAFSPSSTMNLDVLKHHWALSKHGACGWIWYWTYLRVCLSTHERYQSRWVHHYSQWRSLTKTPTMGPLSIPLEILCEKKQMLVRWN